MADTSAAKPAAKVEETSEEILFDFDETSHCIYLSPRAREIFGESQGKHINDAFSEFPEILENYARVLGGRQLVYFEISKLHSWEMQAMKDDDGEYAGAIIKAEILKPARAQLPSKLMPSTWRYDLTKDELSLDKTLRAVLGFDSVSLHVFHAADERTRETTSELRKAFRGLILHRDDFFLREFSFFDIQGKDRWFSIRGQVSNIDAKGHVVVLNGSIEDISDRVELQMSRQRDEVNLLRVQKMEAIGELVGGIAHDFNNILTSVLGYTELALMEVEPEDLKLTTYLNEVFQGGKRARELVSKMLTFSRADQVQPQNLDLMHEVKDVVKMLRASLPSSIEIRIDIEECLPEIFMDQSFLQQIIMNVCINSRDAMQETGTIFIRGRSRFIDRVHCSSCHTDFSGEHVELSIEDTGPGIPGNLIERIFEPYVSTKDAVSGMGLAMVHGIMHRQGGHVRVDSLVGDGTEIRFFLKPAQQIWSPGPEQPYLDIQKSASNREKHILVIDDEVSLAYYLRELLHRKGYEVSVASDSHEAWDLFSANPDKFDLVVTDQTMPGLSGVQLAAKMLTLREDLPIILCTGYSDVVDEDYISQYGIKGFMPKPIDSQELLRNIQELL
jgi:signal transduction histidine kinase/CheY-like chemotaxis protein